MVGWILCLAVALAAEPVSLQVQDAAGSPVREATLELVSADSADLHEVSVRDGVAELTEPGVFDYVVRAEGFVTETGIVTVPGGLASGENVIRLRRAASLTGRVIDLDRKPVTGAQLRLLPPEGDTAVTVLRTDAGGRFSATGLEPGLFRLRTEAEGFLKDDREALSLRAGARASLEIPLHAASAAHLTVRDPQGKAVRGAVISVVTEGPDGRRLEDLRERYESMEEETDEKGSVVLRALPRGLPVRLLVRHPGFAVQTVRILPEAPVVKADLRLQAGGSLRAVFRDGAKRPIKGVAVALESANAGDADVLGEIPSSDEDGAFAVAHLPVGTYVARLQASGFRPKTLHGIEVSEGGVADLGELELSPGATISGKVLSTTDETIPGATVKATFHEQGRKMEEETETDGDGAFTLTGLPARAVDLKAEAEGYGPAEKFRVPPGRENLELRLRPTGAVAGRVFDAESGSPVPHFRVSAIPQRGQGQRMGGRAQMSEEVRDSDGRFRLDDLPEGRWIVHVAASGYLPGMSDPVRVTAAETADVGELSLEAGLRLEGRVEAAADGSPLPGARVSAGGYGSQLFAVTDAEGNFVLEGLTSPTAISATHPTYVGKEIPDVNLSESPYLTLRLDRGGRVEGKVHGPEGEPQPGAQVSSGTKNSITDSEGRYALDGIKPGRAALTKVDVPGTFEGQDHVMVSVRDGETTRHDFGTGARLHGTLSWQVNPAPGARLTLYERPPVDSHSGWNSGSLRSRAATTGVDGGYVFTGLQEGSYSLLVEWEGRRFGREVEMGSSDQKLELTVPDLSIEGRVVEKSTGEPVEGTRISAHLIEEGRGVMINMSGNAEEMAVWSTSPMGTDVSDMDGNFRLLVGQEGSWNINAFKERFTQDREAGTVVEVKGEPVAGFQVLMIGSVGVTLRVVDAETNAPIPGAMGEIGGSNMKRSSNLDAAGTLEVQDLMPGEVTLGGNAESFAPAWEKIELEPGEHREVTLKLDRGGTLRILLPPGIDPTPDTLRGAGLEIQAEDGKDLTWDLLGFGDTGSLAPEGETGQALIHHAPDGLLAVRIGGEGKPVAERMQNVTVPLGGEVTADLR